jgi:hypothetical protein
VVFSFFSRNVLYLSKNIGVMKLTTIPIALFAFAILAFSCKKSTNSTNPNGDIYLVVPQKVIFNFQAIKCCKQTQKGSE